MLVAILLPRAALAQTPPAIPLAVYGSVKIDLVVTTPFFAPQILGEKINVAQTLVNKILDEASAAYSGATR